MFGVFSGHEQQLIHDWIAGDWLAEQPATRGKPHPSLAQRQVPFNSRRRMTAERPAKPALVQQDTPVSDFDQETLLLEQQLTQLPTREARMRHLLPLLAPTRHHSAAGLLATRIFTGLFN
jgi:hypothetical protein